MVTFTKTTGCSQKVRDFMVKYRFQYHFKGFWCTYVTAGTAKQLLLFELEGNHASDIYNGYICQMHDCPPIQTKVAVSNYRPLFFVKEGAVPLHDGGMNCLIISFIFKLSGCIAVEMTSLVSLHFYLCMIPTQLYIPTTCP